MSIKRNQAVVTSYKLHDLYQMHIHLEHAQGSTVEVQGE